MKSGSMKMVGRSYLSAFVYGTGYKIVPVSDPLMLAVNPKVLQERTQYHLIVENKTTYQALLPTLRETGFSSLIYGSGNKIVKSIEQFEWQLPMDEAEHTIYYFGDIDRSGFTIWHSLTKRRRVLPAVPFYEGVLDERAVCWQDESAKRS